jgi:hypothetical protein
VRKDQRSRPLTLRNSSKLGGSVSSGGGATMTVGLSTVNDLGRQIRVQTGGVQRRRSVRSWI